MSRPDGSGPGGTCTSPAHILLDHGPDPFPMTLAEFIGAARDGGTVRLDSDQSEAVEVPIRARVHIDLGGHTWTAPAGSTPLKVVGADVRISNGTIRSEGAVAVRIGAPGSEYPSNVTLDPDVHIVAENHAGIFVSAGANLDTYADITVTGEFGCVQGNGSEPHWGNSVRIGGGTLTSDGVAVYWPQVGDLTVSGGDITGSTGIEMRAGRLLFKGGTVTGTAVPASVTPNGNGSTSAGAGIAVTQHTTRMTLSATVTGGTVKGYTAVYQANPEGNPAGAVSKVGMRIDGGMFGTVNGGTAVLHSENISGYVTGGTFDRPLPAGAVAPGSAMVANPDGTYGTVRAEWSFPDGAAVGGGFGGLRRLILTCPSLGYSGGFAVPVPGFGPVAVTGASARGGIDAWLDPETGLIHLYRAGSEVSGTVEGLTLVMVGH